MRANDAKNGRIDRQLPCPMNPGRITGTGRCSTPRPNAERQARNVDLQREKTNGPPVQRRGPFVLTVKETARLLAGAPQRGLAAAAARLTNRGAAARFAAAVVMVALVTAAALLAAARGRGAARGFNWSSTSRGSGAGRSGSAAGSSGAAAGGAAARLAAMPIVVAMLVATVMAAAVRAAAGRSAAARFGSSAARGGGSTTRGLATAMVAECFRIRRDGHDKQAGDEQSRQHNAGFHEQNS